MDQRFTQSDGSLPAFVGETDTSAFDAVVATVLLAFFLQVFWRCCCSCYRGHIKRYFSSSSSSAANMDPSVIAAVEEILNYRFKNKSLLEEALTHSSFSNKVSYERLEFIGDAALGLAVANHFFSSGHPELTPGQLTKLRKDCVSNEKLASVAAKHGLYWFLRRINTDRLDQDVRKYEEAVKGGGDIDDDHTIKRPKIMADIVESLAGAVYLDVNSDLAKLWMIFEDLLVDESMVPEGGADSETDRAQNKLYGLCRKRKWTDPHYRVVKEDGPPHEKKFVYSVEIEIEDELLSMEGDEKSTKSSAKNSAAYLLLRYLQESGSI